MSLSIVGLQSMIRTGLRGWLVVRQGLTRRIYGAADAGLVISFATYPSRCPAARLRRRGGFMQLRWFHIRSIGDPGCVCRSSRDRHITSVIQLLWWWLVYEEGGDVHVSTEASRRRLHLIKYRRRVIQGVFEYSTARTNATGYRVAVRTVGQLCV